MIASIPLRAALESNSLEGWWLIGSKQYVIVLRIPSGPLGSKESLLNLIRFWRGKVPPSQLR
jgi:hypothetical protein